MFVLFGPRLKLKVLDAISGPEAKSLKDGIPNFLFREGMEKPLLF